MKLIKVLTIDGQPSDGLIIAYPFGFGEAIISFLLTNM